MEDDNWTRSMNLLATMSWKRWLDDCQEIVTNPEAGVSHPENVDLVERMGRGYRPDWCELPKVFRNSLSARIQDVTGSGPYEVRAQVARLLVTGHPSED